MSAPIRTLPDSADDAAWLDPATVADIAGVSVRIRTCCGTLVDSEPDYCLVDGWVRDVDLRPDFYSGRSLIGAEAVSE